jgi:outer membrane receptor for ferrienterochelin and colicins
MKDYGGLFNRSKHVANLQLTEHDKKNGLTSSIRAVYRGRFGYSDLNGNAILDDDREYVNGYLLVNASVSKTFKKGIEAQLGSDNILNHRDKDKLPNLYGRTYFINFSINLHQLLSNKTVNK